MNIDRGIGTLAGTQALSSAQNVIKRIVAIGTGVSPGVCRSKNSDLRRIVSHSRGKNLRFVKF